MKNHLRFLLIFTFSLFFLTLKSQLSISVLTNAIKSDHYSFGNSEPNYGVKFNGEYYFPDLQMDCEYKENLLSLSYVSNRYARNGSFFGLSPGVPLLSRIKAIRMSLGRRIKLTERLKLIPAFLFQKNFDSVLVYFAGVINNGWEALLCDTEYGKFSYGLGLALDYNFSTNLFARLESSFVRYDHEEQRCPDYPLDFNHVNLWSYSLKFGFNF